MIVIGGDTRISCSGVYAGWPYYIPCGGGPAPGGAREKVLVLGPNGLLFIPDDTIGLRINGSVVDQSAFTFPLLGLPTWDGVAWRGLFANPDSGPAATAVFEAIMAGTSYASLPPAGEGFEVLIVAFSTPVAEIEIDRGQGYLPCDVHPIMFTSLQQDEVELTVSAYTVASGPYPGVFQVEDAAGNVLETQAAACTEISTDGQYVIDLTPFALLNYAAGHRLRAVTTSLTGRWNGCPSVAIRDDDPDPIGGGET